MFQHPEYPMDMYGVPTFALGQYPPLLMNRREGDNQYSEEELVRMMGNYAKNLGYVYNPNGLTYGDVNSLMNKSKHFWDDWDGNYQIYLWDDDVGDAWSMVGGSGVTSVGFNINDDKIYDVRYRGSGGRKVVTAKSAETKEAPLQPHTTKPGQAVLVGGMKNGENVHYAHIIGVEEEDGFNPLYINYDPPRLSMIGALKKGHDFYENHAEVTKRASVGMIVRDGDPSSPPSDIFMAEDPTQADASNMGGPTAPGNAGVPADVGGDDLVPYDSPSSPPAGVFMNAEYKTYQSKPVRNALFGVAFAVSGLYFWSTAGSVVKNWVVVRVEKYAPKLLEPQFQTMLTLTAFFGIIYFGMKLRGSSKGLTIPSMIDLPLVDA